jgi:heme o synthase
MTKFIRENLKPIDGAAAINDETIRGVAPTRTVGETYAPPRSNFVADLMQLYKARVTALVVLTAMAGFYLGTRHTGASFFSAKLLALALGIGLVSAAAAALNELFEIEADGKMSRTKDRPLPARRMSVRAAWAAAIIAVIVGANLLAFYNNLLTALLSVATVAVYAFIYTPLKKVGPVCTFVGAFPGAMPALLGWTAATGSISRIGIALFAIVFFWQFPHFLSIAWLYREDYERAGIRMLPVLDTTGRATIRQILAYSVGLIPVSLAPFFLRTAGWIYFFGAIILGIGYLFFGIRLALLQLPPSAAHSKKEARELLKASVIYLPLLLGLLMLNGAPR